MHVMWWMPSSCMWTSAVSGASDRNADRQHDRPAERDDEKRGAHRDVQEPVSHPGDGDQLDRDDDSRYHQRSVDVTDDEGQGVKNAAERCRGARDRAADDGRPAPRLLARVGQRLGEAHAHPGAERGRQADQQCGLELLETAAAKIGASVETVPSIMPTSDGWTICNTNSLSSQPQTRPIRRFRAGGKTERTGRVAGVLISL